MRGLVAGIMVGTLALGGCGSRSTGVVEAADGMLSLTVSGPSLPAATERGLHDATAHCAAQGRQTQILGTRMGREDYQMAFRCAGRTTGTPAQTAFPQPVPAAPPMVLLQPEAAPLLNGEAFTGRPMALPPVAAPPSAAAASAVPLATLPVAAASLVVPPGRLLAMPAQPPTLPARAAAAPLPPLSGPVGLRRN